MYKSRLHRMIVFACCIFIIFSMAACSQPQIQETKEPQGGYVRIAPGAYDSEDTAVIVAKQEEQKQITFYNLKKKKNYTLNYDGTTKFMDKYGSSIVAGQLEEGEVVNIQFLKDEKLLSSLMASSDIWTMRDISKFELDFSAGRIKILDEYYNLEESTIVLSDGKQIDFLDINNQDHIKVRGFDHQIYSIAVEKGHGYLRLENEEYFIGGWIEVGQKVIQKIEEDMLLEVPEGSYEVYLSHSGVEGTKEVEIIRNQETLLDVGDLKKDDLIKYGTLIFTVNPSSAKVYIDGKIIDTSRAVKATYGLHQIMAKADGYDSVIQYIRVSENSGNVAITLDEETKATVSDNSVVSTVVQKPAADTSVSQNTTNKGDTSSETVSGSHTTANTVSTGYKVTIEAPVGAEVYVDGNYVGIVPASFPKKKGSHEVIIRKSGYMTRNYTIQVDDENKDISYSFSDLTPSE